MTISSITNKANTASMPAKPAQTGKVKSSEVQSSESNTVDSFDATTVTNKITEALESSTATHLINEQRVNAVKDALEKGTYSIDAQEIAKKMMQMERDDDSFNNSR